MFRLSEIISSTTGRIVVSEIIPGLRIMSVSLRRLPEALLRSLSVISMMPAAGEI